MGANRARLFVREEMGLFFGEVISFFNYRFGSIFFGRGIWGFICFYFERLLK